MKLKRPFSSRNSFIKIIYQLIDAPRFQIIVNDFDFF